MTNTTAKKQTHPADTIFPVCLKLLGPKRWRTICDGQTTANSQFDAKGAVAFIHSLADKAMIPDYLPEIADLELLLHRTAAAQKDPDPFPDYDNQWSLNPSMQIFETKWNSAAIINNQRLFGNSICPTEEAGHTLVWYDPRQQIARVKAASREELFCLKVCAEEMSLQQAADAAGQHPDAIHNALCRTRDQGLLVGRNPKLTRDADFCTVTVPDYAGAVHKFVLQWHITHACDLHCKHCYDRSRRSPMTLEQGLNILDQLGQFCREKNVGGHVCFSGGNPLLSPHFFALYQEAADRGHELSILGNPCSRDDLEKIREIKMPVYYQVSLEGLPEHNDQIRGEGFFARVIEFLGLLRDTGIPSGVMLTLTRDNIDQVLPLGERLRGHADSFTFNRLSPVGEGAALAMPSEDDFRAFLADYHAAMENNPILSIKDNLFNIVRAEEGLPPFDGCTGFGCGAAFNFVALLPDGEVHACRKFPSLIGNAFRDSLLNIYDGPEAQKYRTRPDECRDCELAPTCGGCLAVTSGMGQDCSIKKDPFCWKSQG